MFRGIDVSRYQGSIDWPAVRQSGMEFALIRAGYGNEINGKDPRFEANISGARAAGLDVGVYWFSYAASVADARKEAAVFRQVIAPHREQITYPAAFDYEEAGREYARKHGANPDGDLISRMADAFLSDMKADGWKTALYTNNDFRRNVFSAQTLKNWDLWLADYSGAPDAACAIRQTGSTAKIPGIDGSVDTDVCFKDYAVPSGAGSAVKFDTTGTYTMEPGGVYQLKTTCAQQPKVWSGSPGSVLVLPRFRSGRDDYWYLVAVGGAGSGAGIYACAPGEQGQRRLVVNIAEKAAD